MNTPSGPHSTEALADELQLGQVFQNLLGNALKFHGDRAPRIQVGAESIENGNMWRFSVADNGIGIEKGKRRPPLSDVPAASYSRRV